MEDSEENVHVDNGYDNQLTYEAVDVILDKHVYDHCYAFSA